MLITNMLLRRAGLGLAVMRQAQCLEISEALSSVAAALRRQPGNAALWGALGAMLRLQGNLRGASDAFDKALHLDPRYHPARAGLGVVRLVQGHFEGGWACYRSRWQVSEWPGRVHAGSVPAWDGLPHPGARLLLWCDEQFGEAIQYFRYLPWLKAQGLEISLSVPPSLTRLVRANWPELLVSASVEACDFHAPLTDLPAIWQGDPVGAQADAVPYLAVEPASKRMSSVFTVGIACDAPDASLSAAFEPVEFAALLDKLSVAGIEIHHLSDEICGGGRVGHSAQRQDALDLSRRILAMDLIITSNSLVAHLAGALGKNVWLLLGRVPAHTWLLETPLSPWYPTMRIFRQQDVDSWAHVLARVAEALGQLKLTSELNGKELSHAG